MRTISLTLFLLVMSPCLVLADNWPAWRGPSGDGQCTEKDLPTKWSAKENVVWKIPLPDEGNSTPVIWKDRIFLTQATEKGKKRSTICFSTRDGAKLWEQTVEYAGKEPTHATNPFCSASPATDGERVVVFHGSAGLFCYDLDGKKLWSRELGECFHIWGNGSSPVIWKETVLLNFGPGERTFLLSVDKNTGKDVWKVEEPGGKEGKTGEDWIGSWSTPLVASINGRRELIQCWPGVVKAYDPDKGTLLWSCKGLEKDKAKDRLIYTTPLVTSDVVVAMAGFGGPAIGLKPGEMGDVTATNRLWRHPVNSQRIGSGVLIGEHIYVLNEPGTAQCIEWKSGKVIWNERICGGVWGSFVHADGKLYVTALDGETVIIEPKPKFELIARNKLGERTLSSIVISDRKFYIRTYKHLWCIAKG